MMFLPVLAGLVLLAIVWFVFYLFFPRIKGLLRLAIAVIVVILLMKILSVSFGLFDGFFDG